MDTNKNSANEFESIVKELTEHIIKSKISNFNVLVTYALKEHGVEGLNVVSTKTNYFAELVDSFKEKK